MENKNFFLPGNIFKITVLTLALVGITACANTHKAIDSKSAVIPQKIYKAKPVKYNDGGIWPGDTAKNLLFEDTKAREVGDILTVHLMRQQHQPNQRRQTLQNQAAQRLQQLQLWVCRAIWELKIFLD